ncbi:unnamed protein product [Phyllotreta striolata]|uniref:Uncharacterized protein n=1 Tax=Phyllotreta striolata TaxID=444603 RepID=A0A9N9XRL1_PHYSR|nr:unnamed protein product [Phyllotreta striolata]
MSNHPAICSYIHINQFHQESIMTSFDINHRAEREKVKVKFFQQSKPLEVDLPNETIFPETNFLMMASPVTINETNHVVYNRTER